jgi:hypothetical protein
MIWSLRQDDEPIVVQYIAVQLLRRT